MVIPIFEFSSYTVQKCEKSYKFTNMLSTKVNMNVTRRRTTRSCMDTV